MRPRSFAAVLLPWSGTAVAHGSVVGPASRTYGCRLRWGSDFQNPAMAQQDSMCWQAWQADPNAMWNWNGLYRDGSAGNFQAVVPDGRLCSGGRTEGGRYNAPDAVGAWKTTDIATDDFTVHLYDQAGHGADYFLVHVTEQDFDPATRPLTWSSLRLVARTGKHAPPTPTTSRSAPRARAAGTSCTRSGRRRTWTRRTSCAVT